MLTLSGGEHQGFCRWATDIKVYLQMSDLWIWHSVVHCVRQTGKITILIWAGSGINRRRYISLYSLGVFLDDVAEHERIWIYSIIISLGYAYSAGRFRFRLLFRESEQEWGNHSGQPSDSDCLDRPADKGHSMCRLAPNLGIVDGAWICLHYALRPLAPILGIGSCICLHYTRTLSF